MKSTASIFVIFPAGIISSGEAFYSGSNAFKQPFWSGSRSAYSDLVIGTEPFSPEVPYASHVISPYVHALAKLAEDLSVGALLPGDEYYYVV